MLNYKDIITKHYALGMKGGEIAATLGNSKLVSSVTVLSISFRASFTSSCLNAIFRRSMT